MRLNSLKIAATVVLAAVITLALTSAALAGPPWSDAPASWWVNTYGVTEAQVATVADGYPDGTFRPSTAVTRGQFAKMAVSGLGVATANPAVPSFKDVARGGTFYAYVEGAYAAGLIGGYSTSTGLLFRPNNTITRQQANSILGRYLSKLEIDTTGAIHGDVTNYGTLALWYNAEGEFYLKAFSDWTKVASDHRATTAYLIRRGIIKGSNSRLNPTATLVRAQAATMVLRVKAEAIDILTPPTPPTNLGVVATGAGVQVTQTGAATYVGNDPTPQVTGDTLSDSDIAIYDAPFYGTTYIKLDKSNLSGRFYADLTDVSKPLIDGTHSFTAKVMNANGLVSPASEPVAYVLDTVPPTGSIAAPAVMPGVDYAAVGSAKPVFTVTAADERSGVKSVQFQVAVSLPLLEWKTISTDTAPDTGTSTYAAVWPSAGELGAGLTDGEYLFRAVITDLAGNTRTVGPIKVLYDTVAPTATITAPIANLGSTFYTESTTPVFTATAADAGPGIGDGGSGGTGGASGLAKVEFFYVPWSAGLPTTWAGFTLLSTDTVPETGTATYAAVYSAALPEGRYLFAIRATDRAGNESALMSGAAYQAGVTQEVVIDRTAPVITISAPVAGQPVPDATSFNITWTLSDVSAPTSVRIEHSATGGDPWQLLAETAPFTPGSTGSYAWLVPNITGADITTYRVRITAVDRAGAPVGNIAGHTTVKVSDAFTVYDTPPAPTGVVGDDPDAAQAGVDGRDLRAIWTPSTSTHVSSQRVYVLRAAETLNLTTAPVDVPVASFANNTAFTWTGTSALTVDSRGISLAAESYRIWVVVVDPAGWAAIASSAPFSVTDP